MGKCIWKGKTPSQYQQKINKEIKIKLVSEILQSLKCQMIFMNIGSRCMKSRISDKNLWAPLKIFQIRILLGYILYSGLTDGFIDLTNEISLAQGYSVICTKSFLGAGLKTSELYIVVIRYLTVEEQRKFALPMNVDDSLNYINISHFLFLRVLHV